MPTIPKRAADRIKVALKKFQPIIDKARSRDVNESDTVVIVTDILHEVFGYDKYSEITSEHTIRGTFCDLAIKLANELSLLVEVKAIGIDLKDQHVKQAVDYAVNQGTDWVALTNGMEWRVFKVIFAKPVEHELVVSFNFLALNHRSFEDIQMLGLLAKEGWSRAALKEFHIQQEALSKFTIGALLISDPVVELVRREVRRVSPAVKVTTDQIRGVLIDDVLKREVIESDKVEEARKLIAKASHRALRKRPRKKSEPTAPPSTPQSGGPPSV